mgnify:CR=1 FL=1|tara:strand:- start:76 stop:291 length:216 start_codon:yes stop_codon:yes gene_type:complete
MKRIFIVNIETDNKIKEWGYEPKTQIAMPVLTNSRYNAERKVRTRCCGSEYPNYIIRSIKECDRFLFKPIV